MTNDEESPAIEVWQACNAGADVENRIRELKHEHFPEGPLHCRSGPAGIDRIGSGTYLANAAHFTWKAIARNLMSMFKRLVLPEGRARRSLKTVRAYLLRIPGVVRRAWRGVAVALPAAFRFAGAMSEASRNALALGGSGQPACRVQAGRSPRPGRGSVPGAPKGPAPPAGTESGRGAIRA